ncbi:MAG: thioredoxin domain-containing protein [Chlamydiales bacterium 38-26]|mgnify:CR=1 FL=1|nr:thioredoxin domain-containing protein [Chlamydiales bacterium]OJV08558.1 MAG: thioredoxin domain-containing protein [Chlamydiales bacterium 38-26]
MTDKNLYTNRLIKQKSPYLLQHAHNPVNWYPWEDEAFRTAREEDKPIFLSIGYATCHWCHVMEQECFENLNVAQMMNETFINIKVDREELPEVDGLYMEFAQSMMAGSAGWPLNLVLTPDLKPFFAATYLPPTTNHGLMGLTELIMRIREVWNSEERESILDQASKIVEIFHETIHYKGNQLPEKEQIEDASDVLFKMADPIYGGMKGTPKFPIGYQANFMLRYSATKKDSRAVFLVERTLDMMHRGGIYDHLGGGFSRYSVDEKWLVPHFEKMLYDNALLIESYIETWRMTKKPLYRKVCEEIVEYILRDMTHPSGGFYSAEDADSEGHEGRFYTWPFEEIQLILGKEASQLFCEYYNVTPEGNFEGRNILNTPLSLEEFVNQHRMDIKELSQQFFRQKELLWNEREKRIHPFKDDKILSSWNGLMIHSLVQAGLILSEKNYLNAASNAALFIKENMWDGEYLLRRWREGESLYNAGLDEYAFLIRALISLFEAGQGVDWLLWAKQLTDIVLNKFKAPDEGAFFQTDGTDPSIILRKCQFADGAEPSGNAIHCENLLRLYQITSDPDYLDQAEDIFRAVKKYIDGYSPGYCYHLMNLNRYYDRHAPTIVIALNEKNDYEEEIRHAIYAHYIPHAMVIWLRRDDKKLMEFIPFLQTQTPKEGKTTLYICYEGVCQKPIFERQEIFEAIRRL